MKKNTLKMLFFLLLTLPVASLIAQTPNESFIPNNVGKVLEKIQSVENIDLKEPINLLTKEEKLILQDFYQASDVSNTQFRAIGDVYALDVRNNGIYGTFPLTGPFDIISSATIANNIFASDFDGSGTLYGIDNDTSDLLTVDPDTGAAVVSVTLTGSVPGATFSGLSWNPANLIMYVLTTDGVVSTLYSADLTTGVLTEIGQTGTTLGIWLAIDNSGIIYMADIGDDNLYTLDSATGAATLVGPLGVDISFAQEADVDTATNTLYMAGYIGGGVNNVYSVDVSTGTATALGTVNSDNAELGMFAIEGPAVSLENFTCEEALNVGLGVVNSDGPSNTEGGASNICEAGATNSVWYSYTASNSGDLTITSDLGSNTGVDTRVSVYNDDCTALVCIDSDDNSGADNTSTLVIPVISGTTYYIEWDDANNADPFDFELSLVIACPDPENFTNDAVTDTTADFSWDAVTGATNGYILNVFNAGDDPDVATAVYTENIPDGTLTATATGLMSDSMFDAYLMADCDTDGMSNAVSTSFQTDITPPGCGETYVDSGGDTGDYMNNEIITTTITPDVSGEVVTVTFTYVDIETSTGAGNQDGCWDFLTVYNGPDTSSPVLAQTLCGEESGDGGVPSVGSSLLSVGMSFTSSDTSGALTFVFSSDGSVAETGWSADVTCGPPPMCVTPGSFTNTLTTDTEATYTWDEVSNADNGYVFSVFNAGADPDVDPAVYTENVPFGTNTATATGLTPDSSYDAYIVADCDAAGVSSSDSNTFTTDIAPPVCGGVYLDSGGQAGDYSADEVTTTTITPDVSGEFVTATFTYVDIETSTGDGTQAGCWDYLTVYDGPDTSSPVLAMTLCGEESGDGGVPSIPESLLSVGMSFTSSDPSGALTFVFTSDGSVQETGWSADITCGTLSIGEFDVNTFNYYPNPTTGLLNVNAKQTIDGIKVFNTLGQMVMDVTPKVMETTLDFSELSLGTYFLRASINGNINTHKIVKK